MLGYTDYDATELARMVSDGEVTPLELVDAAADSLHKLNPSLNAAVFTRLDAAREEATNALPDGPFRGVPFVFKDMDGFVAGQRYGAGSAFLQDFVPTADSTGIQRMKQSGIIQIARSNCPEFGIMGTTEPEIYGPCRNPWNLDHSTGGSSGGSAALVAARVVPMAHAGDGGGSIRIPAAHCGLFGIKPTRGRNPMGPGKGEGWGGYVQSGVVTRSVRDAAAMLDATHGTEPGAPYYAPPVSRSFVDEVRTDPGTLRIAFSLQSLYGQTTDPENAQAVTDTIALLEELGHEVTEARPPIDRAELVHAYLVQVAASVAADMQSLADAAGKTATSAQFESPTWLLSQIGRKLSALDLQRSRDSCHRAGFVMADWMSAYDVFVLPTAAHPPVRLGELALKAYERAGLALLRKAPVGAVLRTVLADLADKSLEKTPNTQLFNQTGQPSMSLPLHWTASGLPIGVQVAGRFGDEATLFRLAGQIEEARPWREKRPPVCAH